MLEEADREMACGEGPGAWQVCAARTLQQPNSDLPKNCEPLKEADWEMTSGEEPGAWQVRAPYLSGLPTYKCRQPKVRVLDAKAGHTRFVPRA